MESRHCGQDKGISFCPVHNASTPCSLQAFGIRCILSQLWRKRRPIADKEWTASRVAKRVANRFDIYQQLAMFRCRRQHCIAGCRENCQVLSCCSRQTRPYRAPVFITMESEVLDPVYPLPCRLSCLQYRKLLITRLTNVITNNWDSLWNWTIKGVNQSECSYPDHKWVTFRDFKKNTGKLPLNYLYK